VNFVTPLSHDEDRIDAFHNGKPLGYRTMADILGAELHLVPDDREPCSFTEAEGHTAWRAAMKEEMDAVEKNGTWEPVELPPGHQANTLKWVFQVKKDEAGTVIKHKACLVARGFVRQEEVDFDDTFAPVAQMNSMCLLLALAAQEGWCVHHMDVKSAFLNNDLKEENPPAAGICDPWRGGQGVASAQGTLWTAAGTASVEQDDGCHLEEGGLRAKPARGRRLMVGPE
jgi:hypothetical protein